MESPSPAKVLAVNIMLFADGKFNRDLCAMSIVFSREADSVFA